MKSILREIENEILKYAAVLAEILKVDIEIVDSAYFRVAGTGSYREQKNVSLSGEAYIISKVIETGKQQIVENPREDELCKACQHRSTCKETYEVCTPIVMAGEVIGAIGLVCFTEKQKSHIMWHHDSFILFLNQIAELIASKAFERREHLKNNEVILLLDAIMNNLSEGVLVLNKEGQLSRFNNKAQEFFGKDQLIIEGAVSLKQITKDELSNSIYELKYGESSVQVIGRFFTMNTGAFDKVFIFSTYSKETVLLDTYKTIDGMEEEMIKEALLKHGLGVEAKKKIAEELDIGIATLYRKIKKYDL